MSAANPENARLLTPQNVYRIFKYTIYALLCYNGYLFFEGDLAASAETFGDAITWRNLIEAYSATFDEAAWILLLLLFELETAVIPDHLLRGRLKWVLHGLAGICYFIIIYSFYGYIYKYLVVSDLVPFHIDDVCSLIGTDFTYVVTLDEYLPLDQSVCTAMNGQSLWRIEGTDIIGVEPNLTAAIRLAIVDIVNAATWLIVVALLEIEVVLQVKDRLTDRALNASKYLKGLLYAILFVCAAYWGFAGVFLDFWDAFLWLVAFIFIELNIFQWHTEAEEDRESRLTG